MAMFTAIPDMLNKLIPGPSLSRRTTMTALAVGGFLGHFVVVPLFFPQWIVARERRLRESMEANLVEGIGTMEKNK